MSPRGQAVVDLDLDEARRAVPDRPVRLPGSLTLACAVCGVAVPRAAPGSEQEQEQARVYREIVTTSPAGQVLRTERVAMTRCADCAERLDTARALVATHPAMAARLGPDRAVEVAEGVLSALALLGVHALPITVSDAALGLHVRHLGRLGTLLGWRTVASTGWADPYPFAHVGMVDRQRLRSAYAGLLAERVASHAPPVRLTPPALGPVEVAVVVVTGGCLVCGVDAVTLPATEVSRAGGPRLAARDVWRDLTVAPDALGGLPSPDRLAGHVCPACADALDAVGAVGPTAMERALLGYLDTAGRTDDARRLREALAGGTVTGLVGWGALPSPRVPSGEPWGHVRLG